MKTMLLLSVVLLATTAAAKPVDEKRGLATEATRRTNVRLTLAEPDKSNQIVGERFTLSGIAVQAIKAENPLQLLNPIAPQKYGSGRDNVTREPRTGRVNGLRIFSIEF
jgi:hypothetical protein